MGRSLEYLSFGLGVLLLLHRGRRLFAHIYIDDFDLRAVVHHFGVPHIADALAISVGLHVLMAEAGPFFWLKLLLLSKLFFQFELLDLPNQLLQVPYSLQELLFPLELGEFLSRLIMLLLRLRFW